MARSERCCSRRETSRRTSAERQPSRHSQASTESGHLSSIGSHIGR